MKILVTDCVVQACVLKFIFGIHIRTIFNQVFHNVQLQMRRKEAALIITEYKSIHPRAKLVSKKSLPVPQKQLHAMESS
jgi:hypothetical protein